MQRHQSGFTLIEIAIVLVIIGLLLGGVVKGQELVNSAKVKNLTGDFRNIPVLVYSYQDKFKTLPGDDPAAVTHISASTNGNGNGIIDGNWNDSAGGSESSNFWQHVRLAGLVAGSTSTADSNYTPTNASGGTLGIQSGTNSATATPINASSGANPIRGSYIICSSGIPGKFAKQIDITLDDGNTASGAMLSGSATSAGSPMTAVATGLIDDAASYTVCMGV